MELAAAGVVLVACLALFAQILFLVGKQERAAEARQVALRTAANRLETLLAKNWDELTVTEPTAEAASAEVLALIPSATMSVQVSLATEPVDQPPAKQIRVEVSWTDSAGAFVQPVGLSAWKHQPRPEANE
ncbi:hypothetical protein [Anatilimnocola aggregata]|uniref:hypothetical protein n=1 Tax=Anatilimnocola aggregata TaxID=2528021 RepID=UPI0011A68F11|nr:hypothetical protein [Anatilimnocola aggregata]